MFTTLSYGDEQLYVSGSSQTVVYPRVIINPNLTMAIVSGRYSILNL